MKNEIFKLTNIIFDAVEQKKTLIINDLRQNDEFINKEIPSNIHYAKQLLKNIGIDVVLDNKANEKSLFISVYDDTPLITAVKLVKERLINNKLKGLKQHNNIIVLYEPSLNSIDIENMIEKIIQEYKTPVFIFTDDKIPGLIYGIGKNNNRMDVNEFAEKSENLFLNWNNYDNKIGLIAKKANFDNIKNNLEILQLN